MSSEARGRILERIRSQQPGRAPDADTARAAGLAVGAGADAIPRNFVLAGERSRPEVLDLFAERVSDYRASVIRTSPGALPAALARALEALGSRRLVIPADLPTSWLEAVPRGFEILKDGGEGPESVLSKGQLAACYAVLTGCALGIAETGTIVLDAGPGQGRRALSLLPDHHLCVVLASQVVETVPEAVAAMARGLTEHGRPYTLVSGPSATSDIELVRVEGVHGPRNLEVILVEEEGAC